MKTITPQLCDVMYPNGKHIKRDATDMVMCPICEAELSVGPAIRGVRTVGGGVDRELSDHMLIVHKRVFKTRELGANTSNVETCAPVYSLRL